MKPAKGLLLYSGGLDSLLAAKVLMDQGADILGIHFMLPFVDPDKDTTKMKLTELAKQIELPLKYHHCGQDFIDMLRNPKHGYGKNINPCIDCKIFLISVAAQMMKETGADFIATGEVVGQRPMSQLKNTLKHIINETGLHGKLLRPLSAKLLQPTLVELDGRIDRDQLLDLSGRSRKPQLEMARKYGIHDYASPAGGCLFTEKFVADRVKDLFEHYEIVTPLDIFLLTKGRNFRLSKTVKIVVSRNENDTLALVKKRDQVDYFIESDFKGPAIVAKGAMTSTDLDTVASIMHRYGKTEDKDPDVRIFKNGKLEGTLRSKGPIDDKLLDSMRI